MTPVATDPAKRTRARLSAARRAEILDTAIALVAEIGYEVTTVDAIAEAVGASKATLYRHWADQATLVVAAFNERSGIDLDMIDTGSLPEDMRQLG
jgi:AcrR family transcriptional regulator